MPSNKSPILSAGERNGPVRLDGALKSRAEQWLTRKMVTGFIPMPGAGEDNRQRFHVFRNLYADGDVILAELRRIPPHELTGKQPELIERMAREVEEIRLRQDELRRKAGLDDPAESVGKISDRVAIDRGPQRLEVRIGPTRNWFLILVLPAWFCFSGFMLMNSILGVFGRGPTPWGPWAGLLVGIPFAMMMYFSALYWLWIQGGLETITVSSAGLKVESTLMQWSGTRTFDLARVEHLRFSIPPKGEAWDSVTTRPVGLATPTVAFYYEGKTWRFGSELDDTSALAVIAAIEEQARSLRGTN